MTTETATLRQLAERAASPDHYIGEVFQFHAAANPKAILALLEERDRLRALLTEALGSLRVISDDYDLDFFDVHGNELLGQLRAALSGPATTEAQDG